MSEKQEIQNYERVGEHVSIFPRGRRWYVHYRQDGKPVRHRLATGGKKQARGKTLTIERDLIQG